MYINATVNLYTGITTYVLYTHMSSDCSPFIYCYQTIDTLKEAELARRQILDYLLERYTTSIQVT